MPIPRRSTEGMGLKKGNTVTAGREGDRSDDRQAVITRTRRQPDEGLEETLTLHRLGVVSELGTSLKTTNALESIHARVESRVAKVDHWRTSDQKQRWLATALLDLEPRLRRIKNFRALPYSARRSRDRSERRGQ